VIGPRASPWLGYCALGAYALALFASAPAWPDDWDGVGFVESVRDFDLARFHPHPPGYPVYVALLRGAALLARDPMRACVVVAAFSGMAAIWFVWAAARRVAGLWAACAVTALVGVLPAVWRACSGVGSEAPAFACAAACAWALAARPVEPSKAWRHALALGLGAGLGLGVRLSWAPLFVAALALAPAGNRLRTWGVALAACAAWGVPFVALVGGPRLVELAGAQLVGHLTRWGGTTMTQPGAVRLGWLARDVFVDGFGVGSDTLGAVIGILVAAGCVVALRAWGTSGWPGGRAALAVVVPYFAWIALGQNLREQPRHALPLVVMLAAALALRSARSPRALGVVCALVLLVSMRTAHDALARRSIPPAAQQLVDLVGATPPGDRPLVFGVSSVRFFEPSDVAGAALPAASLGDAQVQLSRLDRLPMRVWVTSEVESFGDPHWPLERVATLCRPPRLDRRAPCLAVDEWKVPYLPRRD
jgi:hypothetical protein